MATEEDAGTDRRKQVVTWLAAGLVLVIIGYFLGPIAAKALRPDQAPPAPSTAASASGGPVSSPASAAPTSWTSAQGKACNDALIPPANSRFWLGHIRNGPNTDLDLRADPGPYPLIVNLGFHGDVRVQENYTHLERAGNKLHYLVLTLGVAAGDKSLNNQWIVGGPRAHEDIDYVRNLVTVGLTPREVFDPQTQSKSPMFTCIDPKRVYLTGIGDGADIANLVACSLPPGTVTSVAVVAPSFFPKGCKPSFNYLMVHGSNDPVVPSAGDPAPRPQYGNLPKAEPVGQQFLDWSGTTALPPAQNYQLGQDIVQEYIVNQGGRVSVLDNELPGLSQPGIGFTWPGGDAKAAKWAPLFGGQAQWSANERFFRFFRDPALTFPGK